MTSGFGRVAFRAGSTDLAIEALGFDMPLGESPGALTRAQFDTAPRMADPLSVSTRARKEVSQVQIGLLGRHALGAGELNALIDGGTRSLYNPLPTLIGDVDRTSFGGSVRTGVPVTASGCRTD